MARHRRATQLLKFTSGLFGAMRHFPPATGGPGPLFCRHAAEMPPKKICPDFYVTNLFCTEFRVESKNNNGFGQKPIPDPKYDVLYMYCQQRWRKLKRRCRRSRRNAATKLIYVAINFYNEGLLQVQRASLGDNPNPSFQGLGFPHPYPYHASLRGRPTKG